MQRTWDGSPGRQVVERSHSQLLPRGPSVRSSSFFTRGNLPEVRLRNHQGSHLYLVTGGSDGGGEGKTKLPFTPFWIPMHRHECGGTEEPKVGRCLQLKSGSWRSQCQNFVAEGHQRCGPTPLASNCVRTLGQQPSCSLQRAVPPRDTPRPCLDRHKLCSRSKFLC